MEDRTKTSTSCRKGAFQPLKLSRLDTQLSKTFAKSKSFCNVLFKQQIPRNKYANKHHNQHHSSKLQFNIHNSFQEENRGPSADQSRDCGKLLARFHRNRSRYQRPIYAQSNQKNTNPVLEPNSQPIESSQALDSSSRFNETRLKFFKKDLSKDSSPNLPKCFSMNFLETLHAKNWKETSPKRQPSEQLSQWNLQKVAKLEVQLIKLINQLKGKDSTLKQLESRDQELLKQASESKKFEVEYYKLLSRTILLEEESRSKERRADELQSRIQQFQQEILRLESEKKRIEEQYKCVDARISKQNQESESVSEWKRINQILSDSLIKLNQENSLIAKKLSEAEFKLCSVNNKLAQSQRLVVLFKSNVELEKDAHQSLVQHNRKELQSLRETIEDLAKDNQTLRRQEWQNKESGKKLLEECKQKLKNAMFFEEESHGLVSQIEQLNERIRDLQKGNNEKQEEVDALKTKISSIQARAGSWNQSAEPGQSPSQEEELQQKLLLLKISHQEKQSKYQHAINQHKQKIQVLQEQIEEIKSITSQTQILIQTSPEAEQPEKHHRKVLKFETEIVELRSRLEAFAIIEKQLRERLQLSAEKAADMEVERDSTLAEKQGMISTLKQRIQLLEKQMSVIASINNRDNPQDDGMLHSYMKDLLTKTRNMEDIISNIHIQNKRLQYELRSKSQLIGQFKMQIQKDGETIENLKEALEQMNKKLVGHTKLFEITSQTVIDEQLRFENYKEQIEETVEEMENEDTCLEGQLKSIYHKLETLEERIDEDDEYLEQQQKESQKLLSTVSSTRECDFFYNMFIEERRSRLAVITFDI